LHIALYVVCVCVCVCVSFQMFLLQVRDRE